MKRLWLDIETRSKVPISNGTIKYASQCAVMILAWALDNGEVHTEDLTRQAGPSDEFYDALQECDEIWAHNSEFDRTCLQKMPWFPSTVPLTKWRCTAALARMHGLPAGLDKLCTIFQMPQDDAKDQHGKELIRKFCIPKRDGTFNDPTGIDWDKFMAYAEQDVHAMRVLHRHLPKWNATPAMWEFWHLDQAMNGRGVQFDTLLATNAVKLTKRAKKKLAERVYDLTEAEVDTATQTARLKEYLAAYGVDLPDMTADTIKRRLADETLPAPIKELLTIRQEAAKSSTTKYQRVLDCEMSGRLYNLLVCWGAARTGRMAGRLFQPQNLPRPKHAQFIIDRAIELFHREDFLALEDLGGTMGLASSCLRSLMVAAEDHKLVVADLSSIEGRVMAWAAGEDWKVKAFADYDRGIGFDMYIQAVARAFNWDPATISKKDPRRQWGKVMELALQYYGGVGAFVTMSEVYGIKLNELADAAWPVLPQTTKDYAQKLWSKAKREKKTFGLAEREWVVCRGLVQLWREAHPGVTGFWAEIDSAVSMALKNPGKVYPLGEHLSVDKKGNWLRIKLPSGRYLSYPSPRLDLETGKIKDFLGINPYTRQWGRIPTYSGKLAENIVQAIAADILMDGLMGAEMQGFKPILSVHDEMVCEPPIDWSYTNHKNLSRIMCNSSPWAVGLPLAAEGFEGPRYKK